MKEEVFVVGHRNPDTDSICASIAYANLKNIIDEEYNYVPKRVGHTNSETKYILKRFEIKKPAYVDTLEPRVGQLNMRKTKGVQKEDSLMRAWEKMKSEGLRTLPVFDGDKLDGIVTQGDIARAMMEHYDSTSLSDSMVSCRNILDTIDGELIVGDPESVFDRGTIAIGAANPDVMIQHIEAHSMVIMGNRADAQIAALEQGATWLIICLGGTVMESICHLAEERGCNIIVTPYSTYKTARLINESMPVRHIMYSGDMVAFGEGDFVKDIRKIMMKKRLRYFPVLAKNGKFMGFISQRNLLDMEAQKVILVDHNEYSQAVEGVESANVLEIIDHHRIGGIKTIAPVYFRNQPLGCTCTIIAQLYKDYGVKIDEKMAAVMCSAIISETLGFRSPTCTEVDEKIGRELADIAGVDIEELSTGMFKAGSDVSDKTEEEICYQDFKTFSVEGYTIGVGQVTVIGDESQNELKERMLPYIQQIIERTHLDMIFLLLTDVMKESSAILYTAGIKSIDLKAVVENAFDTQAEECFAMLPGVVSRKKQFMPKLTIALQSM